MDTGNIIKHYLMEEVISNFVNLDTDEQLLESGLVDSVSLMKVISFIEEKFNIEIREDDLTPDNFKTINNMVAMLNNGYLSEHKN